MTQSIDVNTGSKDYTLSCGANAQGGDVVYTFTTTQAHRVTLTSTGTNSADGLISLRGAPCDMDVGEVGCVDDAASGPEELVVRNLAAGTYFVVLQAYDSTNGELGLSLQLDPPVLPPVNDSCAMPATLVPNMTQTVDVNAGNLDYVLSCASGAEGGDAVYTFTTTQAQRVTITADGVVAADAVISLRGAPCDQDVAEVDCVDSFGSTESLDVLNLPAGTYFVVVQSYYDTDGEFGVGLTLAPPVLPPSNDTCASPATLVPNTSQMVELAGAAGDYTIDCDSYSGGDAVYTFTTTQPQRVIINARGMTGAQPMLELRSAACDPGTLVECATYSGGTRESVVQPNLPAGTYFVVLGSDGTSTSFGVELQLDAPSVAPTNDVCASPDVVTFTGNTATRRVDLSLAAADYTIGIASTDCDFQPSGADVIYSVTIPANQTLTVDAVGYGAGDPVLMELSPSCTMTDAVRCADLTFYGGSETLTVPNATAMPVQTFIVLKAYDTLGSSVMDLTFTVQ
jgi:hypothetical protein